MCDTGLARWISTAMRNSALVSAVAIVAALWMFPAPSHACSCDFPADWGFCFRDYPDWANLQIGGGTLCK